MPPKFVKANSSDAQHIKCLVYGNAGAGKTHFGASSPKPLIVLTEPNGMQTIARVAPDADLVVAETIGEVREVLVDVRRRIAEGSSPWQTIVLDSLTELQKKMIDELLGKSSRDKLTLEQWGLIIDGTSRLLRAFRDLPLHLICICLAEETMVEDARFVRPSLNGKKLPNEIAAFFGLVGYLFKKQAEQGVIHRVLLDGHEGFLTKGDPRLSPLEEPDFNAWLKKLSLPSGREQTAEVQPPVEIPPKAAAPETPAAEPKKHRGAKKPPPWPERRKMALDRICATADAAGHQPRWVLEALGIPDADAPPDAQAAWLSEVTRVFGELRGGTYVLPPEIAEKAETERRKPRPQDPGLVYVGD